MCLVFGVVVKQRVELVADCIEISLWCGCFTFIFFSTSSVVCFGARTRGAEGEEVEILFQDVFLVVSDTSRIVQQLFPRRKTYLEI